jgi:hypothetical protein
MKAKKKTIREIIARYNEQLDQEIGHLPKLRRSYKRKYTGEKLDLMLRSLDLYKLRCQLNRDVSVANLRVKRIKPGQSEKHRDLFAKLRLARYERDRINEEYHQVDCRKAVLDGNHEHMYMSFSTLGFHKTRCPYGLPISEKAPVKA